LATVTWAHYALIEGDRTSSIKALILTIIFAILFTGLQAFEYYNAPFTIADGIYGSCFYFGTGFHGSKKYSIIQNKTQSTLNNEKLCPYWVTGFSDGESTFSLRVTKNSTSRTGWRVLPIFSIELHEKDLVLLEQIKAFFGVGNIYVRKKGCLDGLPAEAHIASKKVIYYVQSFKDLTPPLAGGGSSF
jgi:hypothetical protein